MGLGPIGFVAGEIFGATAGPLTGPFSRATHYIANNLYPNALPSPPEILWAMRTGWITDKAGESLLNASGVSIDDSKWPAGSLAHKAIKVASLAWQKIYLSQRPQPALVELLTLINRGLISKDDLDASLHRQGFDSAEVRKQLAQLRFEIPGPSDLVRFAVRHVFEPEIIQQLGYNDEFRPAFGDWLSKQGLDYPLPPLKLPDGTPVDWTWARAYWWSHWILPANTQGYQMLQRLRPTGGKNGGPRDPSGEVFTKDTLELLLRANDIPPFWRKKLIAISYNPIGLRQAQMLIDNNVSTPDQVNEIYQDLGYSKDNADTMVKLALARKRQREWKDATAGTKQAIRNAYAIGIIDQDSAFIALQSITYVDAELVKDFLSKPDADKLAIAKANYAVQFEVAEVDEKVATERATRAVDATKKMYMRGRISKEQARNRLVQIGIVQTRINDTLAEWDNEFGLDIRELSAQQILNAFKDGVITEQAAEQQLAYLGWSPPYIVVMIETAIAEKLSKLPPSDALLRRVRADFSKHSSPAMMKRWLKEGIMDTGTVAARLEFLGWPLDDVNHFIEDALQPSRAPKIHLATESDLKKWLKEGTIDEPTASAILKAKGWTDADVQRFLEDALGLVTPGG